MLYERSLGPHDVSLVLELSHIGIQLGLFETSKLCARCIGPGDVVAVHVCVSCRQQSQSTSSMCIERSNAFDQTLHSMLLSRKEELPTAPGGIVFPAALAVSRNLLARVQAVCVSRNLLDRVQAVTTGSTDRIEAVPSGSCMPADMSGSTVGVGTVTLKSTAVAGLLLLVTSHHLAHTTRLSKHRHATVRPIMIDIATFSFCCAPPQKFCHSNAHWSPPSSCCRSAAMAALVRTSP